MAAKRALVVDDSKSARTFLAKILQKYELDVVSVESAEQAIEYLAHHRPDVIFMDHMMPGMDGFQAVQTIKNNPRTATIPIMMYTSQEGELYLGQARALGAVGVLPKQIKPADVSKVLYQLHLLTDRRSSEQSTFRAVTSSGVEIDDGDASPNARTASSAARRESAAGAPLTESALREQIGELRRSLAAQLENQLERLKTDLHAALRDTPAALRDGPAALPIEPAKPRSSWTGLGVALAGLLAVVSLAIAGQQAARTRVLAGEIAALRATLVSPEHQPGGPAPTTSHAAAAGTASTSSGGDPQTANAARGDPGESAASSGRTAASASSGAAVRRSAAAARPIIEVVPYGEDPFGGPRLDALRQLFDRLAAQGFRGTVEVKVFPGRFCLAGNSTDGFAPAADETPYARCDLVGSSLPRDESGSPRISVAFADLAAELRSASHGAIDVQVLSGDDRTTLVAYPPISDSLTAGEWNRAADANNRMEIRLR